MELLQTNPSETMPEREYAVLLGLDRATMKKVRRKHLTPEEDWRVGAPNGSILLTASGRKKIRAALNLPEALLNAPEKKEGAEKTLVVYRITKNPHIIEMRTLAGVPARLRVKSAANFMARMEVPHCVLVQADLYDYRGKLPRRRGRIS